MIPLTCCWVDAQGADFHGAQNRMSKKCVEDKSYSSSRSFSQTKVSTLWSAGSVLPKAKWPWTVKKKSSEKTQIMHTERCLSHFGLSTAFQTNTFDHWALCHDTPQNEERSKLMTHERAMLQLTQLLANNIELESSFSAQDWWWTWLMRALHTRTQNHIQGYN